MKKILPFILLLFMACQKEPNSLTTYVNPFIGTGGHGHTYPGASTPFGMVQLSPDSRLDGWDGCGGYHYSDSIIYGFSHTHLSGTGVSDYGDILLIPTAGKLYLNNGSDGNPGYSSTFSHENETATAGYYNVLLEDYNVNVELTASQRVGFHKYTFPESKDAHIILDMVYNVYHHNNKNVWTFIRVENDSLVTGYRQTKGWARTRKVFFAMKFSKAFKSYGHKKYNEETYDGFYRRFKQDKDSISILASS